MELEIQMLDQQYPCTQTQKNQTQFFYGTDAQQSAGPLLKQHGATKVLVLYGMIEWRNTLWYQQMLQSLRESKLSYTELGGALASAELEQIEIGIALCKKEHVDYILAVGGGSVIDSAKAIAMGAVCDNCIWTYFTTEKQPKEALPLSVLLTIPGSGSESNAQTMITNQDTMLKLCCHSPVLQPQTCIVNPEIFYTISKAQLAHAVVAMMYRMICSYLVQASTEQDVKRQKRLEQRLKLLMRKARKLQADRFDETSWLELVLLDNMQEESCENTQENSCQQMAAELSAMYDIPYGAILAVLLPAWLQFISRNHMTSLRLFAKHVMNISDNMTAEEQVTQAISKLQDFFAELQLANNLCDLGIHEFCLKNAAQICTGYGWGEEKPVGVIQTLYWQDLYQIYQSVCKRPMLEKTCSA